jgi:tripartite-type tricarboxylate transporter receptor subunit TctC
MFDQLSSSMPYINSGKVRALGLTTSTRSALYPNLPTIAETGLPSYEWVTYSGFVAPAGSPRDALARLRAEIAKAAQAPDLKSRLLQQGIEITASASPEEFAAYLRDDQAKMAKLVRDAGIRGED